MSDDLATEALVRRYFDAFITRRRDDFEAMLADGFTFTSPYDDAIDRAAFFERCWPNGDRFTAFRVERVIARGDDAYITYFCTARDGSSFRNTEHHVLRDGRLAHVEVYFGASYRDGKFVTQE